MPQNFLFHYKFNQISLFLNQDKEEIDSQEKVTPATTIIENIDSKENGNDAIRNDADTSNIETQCQNAFEDASKVPGTSLDHDLEELKMDDVDIDKVDILELYNNQVGK